MNPFPPLKFRPAPDGLLDRIVADGRRRRIRAVASGTGGLAGVTALVLLLSGTPDGTSRLLPTNEPTEEPASPEWTASPSPVPEGTPAAEPSPYPTQPPSGEPSPSPTGTATASPSATPEGVVVDRSPAVVTAEPEPDNGGRGVVTTHDDAFAHAGQGGGTCANSADVTVESWCFDVQLGYDGQSAVASKAHPTHIRVTLCRPAEAGSDGLVAYTEGQEFELVIGGDTAGAGGRYTWSHGRSVNRSPHTVSIGPDHCLLWELDWAGTDDAGDPLPAGTYSLHVEPRGSDSQGALVDRLAHNGSIAAG